MATWRNLDWPDEMPIYQRHLILWQQHREEPWRHADLLNPVSEHFLEACRYLFTPKELVIHPWFEDMARLFTDYTHLIFMGAASSGKSHAIGLILLLDYLIDPQFTYTCLVSTSKDMLLMRSMAASLEYLRVLQSRPDWNVPFRFVAQKCAILPSADTTDIVSARAMIKGVAIREGSSQDAKAAMMGVHLPRVRMCADEMENMGDRAKTFLEVQDNLAVASDFKAIALFNPQSRYSPGTRLAEPKDGWSSLDPEVATEWVSRDGWRVLRLDGHKSPGIKEPKVYPFLPTFQSLLVQKERNGGNEDSPGYMTFARAWPPASGLSRTVISPGEWDLHHAHQPVTWKYNPTLFAACDPSFSEAGDSALLYVGAVGVDTGGKLVVDVGRQRYVLQIKTSDPRPVAEQLLDQIVELLNKHQIPQDRFGIDDSGSQSIGDLLVMHRGSGIYRVNFTERPPDIPCSVANPESAQDRYRNRSTWMYFTVADYLRADQLRNVPLEAATQLSDRRLKEDAWPMLLEPKKDYRSRHKGQSPDDADAMAMLCAMLRERYGLMPGATEWDPAGYRPPAGNLYDPARTKRLEDMSKLSSDYLDEWRPPTI